MRLYLASTSPARLTTLRAAGIDPIVVPSNVDEDAAVELAEKAGGRALSPAEMVQLLARVKAEAVITPDIDGLVLGGDSAFELDGVIYGKPHTEEKARERWQLQRGQTGRLYSGHWMMRVQHGEVLDAHGEVSFADVTFADDISDEEIQAYIASGEPLNVAGAFTIDSLGAAYITRIDGDPSTVVGVSVPVLRRISQRLGVDWHSLWGHRAL